jgi:hypothetical protein
MGEDSGEGDFGSNTNSHEGCPYELSTLMAISPSLYSLPSRRRRAGKGGKNWSPLPRWERARSKIPPFDPSVSLGVVSLSFDFVQDSELVELSNHWLSSSLSDLGVEDRVVSLRPCTSS